ncbi:MAG: hypothetical protein VE98_C0001G0083 [candidate division Kazan bacterium GW2011_GWA1_50_15]|uniref:GIY-YIG nuclease superfamily protein n=2 Tax=Bacteria division Kazan-3B-28 TaxID=1798534 RepID=A0A0G2A3Z8_UNCK3|nr:MAG: hypothetical protein VE98_C0001G0083 [candidate division Kazan bacterium GW2011_GWA1_50_15]KKW25639.1 MAG: GIY-YIG nuclease superfamily protein [candidate division Kazan bacterium GW2011_GWC1_52_13]KKW26944.1 MAG: GIY-YIG nuclease superfamily protein [candidate division Kazan bacterium GW2011_GWB1_52_7]
MYSSISEQYCGYNENMYYVYVLQSKTDRDFYIGFIQDIKRRLYEHKVGKNVSTKSRGPWTLIYFEGFIDKFDALRRESYMKITKGHAMLKMILREYLLKQAGVAQR